MVAGTQPRLFFLRFVCMISATLLIAALSGCAVKGITEPETVSLKQRSSISNGLRTLYPDRFKAIHRVVLNLGGNDYVLNGYLAVDRQKNELKLVAQNDFGGTVFDVHYIENNEPEIKNYLTSFKTQWLEESLLRDLKTLYLLKPVLSDRLVWTGPDTIALYRDRESGTSEMIFRSSGGEDPFRLQEIRHANGHRTVYSVRFRYADGRHSPYPESVFIKDARMRYNLKIHSRYLF